MGRETSISRRSGKKIGKLMPQAQKAIGALDRKQIQALLSGPDAGSGDRWESEWSYWNLPMCRSNGG